MAPAADVVMSQSGSGPDPGMTDGAATTLQDDVLTQVVEELVRLPRSSDLQ